ncbi:MAG: flagellar M-ring protein FliF C-terminal domain-containing protein, partial [Ignavibacteria bacterium]|nr:flagellar M-ring protein FliF C-terminal domain-containing protein [Ignavibacteria bacterium]
LEGEIARTIQQQEGIAWARVHVVMPKKTIFREEEKQPNASVVIKLKNNSTPSKENIQAIVNLMCGSVEGLQPAKVSVIDTKGRILSNDAEEGPMAFASAKQYEIKKSVENHLVQKAQAILDNVLGFGNAMVQVNADINFDQVEKTMTQFDPESQVVVSEGIAKTASNGRQQSDTTSAANENAVTNYEISKTVQNVVEGTGNIKRLSVATVINDIPREVKEGNKTKIVFDPRPADQIKKLEDLVKNAVGIDPTRNDQFTIVNIPFETKVEETTTEAGMSALPDANEYINLVFILVAIVSSLFVLKSLMKRLKNEKIVIGTVSSGNYAYASEPSSGSLPAHGESKSNGTQQLLGQKKKKMLLPMGDIEDEISDDALAKKNQQERIVNYVTKNPMDAAKLINAWMHEDEA